MVESTNKRISRLGSVQEELTKVDSTRPDDLPINKEECDEPPTPNPLSATYKKRLSL